MSKAKKRNLSLEVPEAPLRLYAENLQEAIKTKEAGLVIIDVRGEDYKGGHIAGCINVPYDEFPDCVDSLIAAHRGAKKLVFCCMNSQVQSPSCAVTFLTKMNEDESLRGSGPEVYILIGGVQAWIRAYHQDESLVTDFDSKLWAAIWEATELGSA